MAVNSPVKRIHRRYCKCQRCASILADKRSYYRKRYYKYREKNIAYQKAYKNRIRKKAFSVLGGACCICGFSDIRALQIDHVKGGGSIEHRKIGFDGILRNVIKGRGSYQLLCANCNWIKRAERAEVGHRKKEFPR